MDATAPPATVLVVNPGSSTLKLSVLGPGDATLAEATIAHDGAGEGLAALAGFVRGAPAVDAGAVRVVHGGAEFSSPVVVDGPVLERLERLDALAPLHNPPARHAIAELRRTLAGRPVVACFDTAFHATIGDAAAVYAVPWAWTSRWGLRRYGFHGLSHAWASRRAAELLGADPGRLGLVSCHLGAGASLAAVAGGTCVDTTMGFTPMEGLVMATRSGSVDPGLLLWVMRHRGLGAAEVERILERESGLLGLSEATGDMRELERRRSAGDPAATRAVDVFLHRLRAGVGAMAASLERLDAVVFTGGVGEHSSLVREACSAGLAVLGLPARLGPRGDGEDALVSPPGARVSVLVVRAREDREAARLAREALRGRQP